MKLKYWPGTSFRGPEFAFRVGDDHWEATGWNSTPRSTVLTDADVTEDRGWTSLSIANEDVPPDNLP